MSQKPMSYDTLKNQINTLTNQSTLDVLNGDTSQSKSYADYAKPPYIFAAVPIIVAIILYYTKPFFIMDQNPKYEDGDGPKILSYKKLGIFSVVISAMIVGAYYYYYGKSQKKLE